MRSAAIALCLTGFSSNAFAQSLPPALDQAIAPFKAKATTDQTQQLTQAIAASPDLQRQLSQAVSKGRLRGIMLKAPGDGVTPPGPFGAFMNQGTLYLTPAFLDEQTKAPADANSLVFALGHMAQHIAVPPPTPATFAFPIPPRADQQIPLEDLAAAFTRARTKAEAEAYLLGWNDMVQAAARQNGGKPLSESQISKLLQGFRYRAPFIAGMDEDRGIRMRGNGLIDISESNIGALARALGNAPAADIE